MFGTLRLILAAVVVWSHYGNLPAGLWVGMLAVVVFYMLSGYAMTGLITSRFNSSASAHLFFLERIVRLGPQYYFWLMASLCAAYFQVLAPHWEGFLPKGLLAYLTVIPLGTQRYTFELKTLLMPQATTLAIEITFYLLSPWVLRSMWLSWGAALVSVGIFAATAAGLLPPNIYTYYNTPGPLAFYVLGSFLYRKDWRSLGLLATMIAGTLLPHWERHFDLEWLLALVFGLPILIVLSRLKPNRLDGALGDASYGCFLGHMIIMALVPRAGIPSTTMQGQCIGIALSCLAGYAVYYVLERPTVPYRRSIKTRPGGTAPSKCVR